ncbi:MAG: hypothetical protein NUW37_11395 [Planctomycetes bacterium]|nr:hypothetical protein [Planctomycetota bacterium]
MPETVDTLVGVMDPNGYSLITTLEAIFAKLDLHINDGGKIHRVKTRRLKSRPYDVLHCVCPYKAILNRGTHWNPHFNSYLMTIAPETYILNDMVSFKAIDKNTGYGQMSKLGMKIPTTVAIPQQSYEDLEKDKKVHLDLIFCYNEFFDLKELGDEVGYPAYLKPQSGGGWVGVERVENFEELLKAYNKSGDVPQNLQKAVDYKEFIRTVGVGPQTFPMHYNATAKHSHDRYMRSDALAVEFGWLPPEIDKEVRQICKIINAFYNWHHNSCESLWANDGEIYPIDFCNAYPDTQFTSLHFYFPGVVKAMVKWLTFCAVTDQKGSTDFMQDWPKYFSTKQKAEKEKWSYGKLLDEYEKIADEHFKTKEFEAFCAKHLSHVDEVCYEFFASDAFDAIVSNKIERYFKIPEERPLQYRHYRGIVEFWLHCERQRLGIGTDETAATSKA